MYQSILKPRERRVTRLPFSRQGFISDAKYKRDLKREVGKTKTLLDSTFVKIHGGLQRDEGGTENC